MAKKRVLVFRLLSFWHVASGRGAAEQADSMVVLDATGLPVIPGRTVKGLVRDALELAADAGALSADRVVQLFGSPAPGEGRHVQPDDLEREIEENRFDTQRGQLVFGSACLPDTWRRWVAAGTQDDGSPPAEVLELFHYVASTAIDARGVAQNHTLRTHQVAVPMSLQADVEGPDDGQWVGELQAALPLLRHLGSRRSRGYGRVQVTLEEEA